MIQDTGYWIECVPLRQASFLTAEPGLYAATIPDFPDLRAYGVSPDRAITKLKRRLEMLRRDCARGTAITRAAQPAQAATRFSRDRRLDVGISGFARGELRTDVVTIQPTSKR